MLAGSRPPFGGYDPAALPATGVTTMTSGGQVTQWLARWRAGDRKRWSDWSRSSTTSCAGARRQLHREASGHTLSATALVHEVYLRLLQQRQLAATDRDGFLAIVAQTMRRILVDHARARSRLKRGGGERPVRSNRR